MPKRASNIFPKIYLISSLIAVLLILPACRKVELGIEEQSEPNIAATGTIIALQTEVGRLQQELDNVTEAELMSLLGKVAYVQGGDIWTKVLPDGEPQRLTNDGRSIAPKWSPSGEWLAFQKGDPALGQLWIMRDDGTEEHPIVSGESNIIIKFAWSPQEDILAYATLNGSIWIINADGTEVTELVMQETNTDQQSTGLARNFAWSPDGQWLAYEWMLQRASTLPNNQSLRKVSVATAEQLELYRLASEGILQLAGWSSQGTRIFFWQYALSSNTTIFDGVSLYAVYADSELTGEQTPETISSEPMIPYEDFVAPAPSNSFWGTRDEVALVVGMGTDTTIGKRVEVGNFRISPLNFAAILPAWSPDGNFLAFSAMTANKSPNNIESGPMDLDPNDVLLGRRIWIAQTNGEANPQPLTNDPQFRDERPQWSVDGSFILFARINGEGQASLWLVRSTGGRPRLVVNELTPTPDLGEYTGGYIREWNTLFDWWRSPYLVPVPPHFPSLEDGTTPQPLPYGVFPSPTPAISTPRPIFGLK